LSGDNCKFPRVLQTKPTWEEVQKNERVDCPGGDRFLRHRKGGVVGEPKTGPRPLFHRV